MVEDDHTRERQQKHAERHEVRHGIFHLLHAGTPVAAVVAAAGHGERELIRAAERRHEQRDQNRDHRVDTIEKFAAFKVCAAGLLRVGDAIDLLDQRRDEPQCQRHHHGKGVHGNMEHLQRRQQPFDRVSQLRRRRGIGQKRTRHNQADDTYRHEKRGIQAAGGDRDDPERNERRAPFDVKDVQNRCDQNDRHDGLEALEEHPKRHFGQQDGHRRQYEHHGQGQKVFAQENDDDKQRREDQLHAPLFFSAISLAFLNNFGFLLIIS